MFNKLSQRFPFQSSIARRFKTALLSGGVVMLVMLVFMPTGIFGYGSLLSHYALWSFLSGAGCTFFISLCYILLPYCFPFYFEEENWYVWKEIIMFVAIISLMAGYVQALDMYFSNEEFTWLALQYKLYYSFIISVFPITVVTLLRQKMLLNKYRLQASEINTAVSRRHHYTQSKSSDKIVLKGENRNEEFSCTLQNILFIKAADNYVQICYWQGETKNVMLRQSLKNISESLSSYPQIYKCHRSYLVNLLQVQNLSGNAQGYLLHLHHCTETVPVSRQLNSELKEKMQSAFA